MRNDPGTNYTFTAGTIAVTDDTVASPVVDHKTGSSATFVAYASAVGTSLNGKVQSSPDNSTWTDGTAAAGNDTDATALDAAGTMQLSVPNPVARYSRVLYTGVGAIVGASVACVGPLRRISV